MWEVTRALDEGGVKLHAKVKLLETSQDASGNSVRKYVDTTPGRLLFE